LPVQCLTPLFAPFVSAEAVTAAVAAAAVPAPSRRALSSQQGALRVAVAPAEGRRVRCGPFLIPPGAPRGSQAPRAAWACARHAPRTLGGEGACKVGFLCSVGRLRAYLGDCGAAHRPPTVKKKKSRLWRVGGRVLGGTLWLWGGGVHSPKCLFSSVCEAAAFRRISIFTKTPPTLVPSAPGRAVYCGTRLVLLIGDTLICASRSERSGLGSLVLLIGDTLPRASRAGPCSLVLLIGDTLPRASHSERAGPGSRVLLARRAGQSSAAYWRYAAPRLSLRTRRAGQPCAAHCSSLVRSLLPLWYLPALTKVHRPLLKILL